MNEVAHLLCTLELTAAEIAVSSRLPLDRVQAIMEGAPVTLPEIRAISRGLHIPMRVFATGERTIDRQSGVGVLFRGTAQNKDAGQRGTIEYVATFVEAALTLLPDRRCLPRWMGDLVPAAQTFREAHRLAHQCRSILMPERMDDPADDLPQLLAAEGNVVIGALQRSRYEGASVRAAGHSFIFVSPRFPARMLFTTAHELGHIIAHHGVEQKAIFDSISQIASWKRRTIEERFVDAFASIFLLPDRGVALALKYIRESLAVKSPDIGDIEILYMARYFGVSFEVAARRCEQLELLPEGGALSLTEALKKNFKSPEKRADQLGISARPPVMIPRLSDNLLRPLVEKIDEGMISAGWAAERFGLSIAEIYEAHARFGRAYRH